MTLSSLLRMKVPKKKKKKNLSDAIVKFILGSQKEKI